MNLGHGAPPKKIKKRVNRPKFFSSFLQFLVNAPTLLMIYPIENIQDIYLISFQKKSKMYWYSIAARNIFFIAKDYINMVIMSHSLEEK